MAAGLLLMQANGLFGPREDFDHPDSVAARQAAEAGVASTQTSCPTCGARVARPIHYQSMTSTPNYSIFRTSDVNVVLDEAH